MVTPADLRQSSMNTAKMLLDLLGFQYSGHKLKPFEPRATSCALESLQVMMRRLATVEPSKIPCCDLGKPTLFFTDGASEETNHTIGGVVMIGETVEYFSCSIPEVLVAEWAQSYLHFIGLVELYAILVARMLWPAYIDGSRAIFFIDNKSAVDACIKGTSGSQPVRRLLLCWEKLEEASRSWAWFTRVPSQSNPSDEPSRACSRLMKKLGARRLQALCPLSSAPLQDLRCDVSV